MANYYGGGNLGSKESGFIHLGCVHSPLNNLRRSADLKGEECLFLAPVEVQTFINPNPVNAHLELHTHAL